MKRTPHGEVPRAAVSPGAAPVFTHDGTADGFLCALACALEAGPEASVTDAAAESGGFLFDAPRRVATDAERARRLLAELRERLSPASARRIWYASLADVPGAGAAALAYLRLAERWGARVDDYQAEPAVRRLHALAARVGAEIHRLKGLTRFRKLKDGGWWAPLAPDHRVLWPVALHFRRRMPQERWLLHDVRRGIAVVWDGRDLSERRAERGEETSPAPLASDEAAWEELWRGFFRRIAVPGRENPALQARNMPRRYWRRLVELCE